MRSARQIIVIFTMLAMPASYAQFFNLGTFFKIGKPYSFAITGITGGTDNVVDAYLANGNDPTVNFTDSPGALKYDILIKTLDGVTTVCSLLDWSAPPAAVGSCGLSNGVEYRAYVTAENIDGASTRTASNDGYAFMVGPPVLKPAEFLITGATGGADTYADAWLADGLIVTANWQTSLSATSYDVLIRNEADTTDVCATQNTAGTSYTFTGCTLTLGTKYRIKVTANLGAETTVALNNGFIFEVVNGTPQTFLITGATAAPNDTTADQYLMDSTIVTANWAASTGATSYDVTIRDAGDTTDVCATQNTAGTSYTFTGCTLTATTTYKIKVIAKNALAQLEAFNSLYSFYVADAVNCSTATHNVKALTIYDSGGSGGNYSINETCDVTLSPPVTANAIRLEYKLFESADAQDSLTAYDGTSIAGTNLGANANLLAPPAALPATKIATSGNMFLQWISDGATNSGGFHVQYIAQYSAPGSFTISGVTGGADVTADDKLTAAADPTITWSASSGASNYRVQVRNAGDNLDVCAINTTASTNYTFTGCTLTEGYQYRAIVYSISSNGDYTQASNSPFLFTFITQKPGPFTISGVTGANDTELDANLMDSLNVIGNWNDTTLETSYKVAVYEDDGVTLKCAPEVTTSANATSFSFSSCGLTLNSYYRLRVIAENVMGQTPATNNYYRFSVKNWWTPTSAPGGALSARTRHSAVWTGTEMIVWGGTNGSSYFNTGAKYNPATDSWSAITTTGAPPGVADHTAVWTGTKMIVYGGEDVSGEKTSRGNYDPALDTWSSVTVYVPGPRLNYAAVWSGSEVLIWGGEGLPVTLEGLRYNPTTDVWQAMTMVGQPELRANPSGVWTGTEMLVWGGKIGSTTQNSGGRYNPALDQWNAISISGAPSARIYHSAIWSGTYMVIWGGSSTTNAANAVTSGGRYNPTTDTWTTTTLTNVPVARIYHTTVWTGTVMIVWGGFNTASAPINTGGRYDPVANTWVATQTTNAPVARSAHSAVWTGTEMIVFGGESIYQAENTGGRYNLGTNTWTNLLSNIPTPRYHHTAQWTGSEMIIWGGWSPTSTNTGAKYNPTTDSWTATTLTSAPAGRTAHSSVWTGTEMIIWGGLSAAPASLNTGARYNPATDTWTATTATGAPSARYRHTAVWTGTEMIIWGGGVSASMVNTGARYNPTTNTWTATTTTGAPTGRGYHLAVWSGSEMIVWGGAAGWEENYYTHLVSGGRYNPSTDTWTTVSPNAPSFRARQSAVWTGTEMLVWGGVGHSTGTALAALNTGFKYNPTTDSYSAITTTSAPVARSYHSAVWSGSQMVIFGGINSAGTPINTGGRYNPSTDVWTATTTTGAPVARQWHLAEWTGSKMLIWGGLGAGSVALATGAQYDPALDSWTAITSTNAPSARAYASSVWTGTELIVWGGGTNLSSSTFNNTGARYNPTGDTWTAVATLGAPAKRAFHSAVWSGTEMIIWSGMEEPNNYTARSGARYNPTSNSWTAMSITSAPLNMTGHRAIWTGSKMVVWGGGSATPPEQKGDNVGGIYDPATDSWTATSLVGVPNARALPSAVWTGTEMIIWGGSIVPTSASGTGAKLNPTTNTWTAMSGTPEHRIGGSAVWTGTDMIVWGGNCGTYCYLNSGSKYNPSSDTWTVINSTGAPTERGGHTAIWTGTEMIIWGGTHNLATFVGNLANGAKYNPTTDTWAAVASSGVLSGRALHTAVWNGTEMIVWGGLVDDITDRFGGDWHHISALYSGGKYNPSTDSWVLMSTGGADPFARSGHFAVWNGTKMFVWGGIGLYDPLYKGTNGDGALYDPATSTWTKASLVGEPKARDKFQAVWTGTEAIIWGGDLSVFGTGPNAARYNPSTDVWTSVASENVDDMQQRSKHTAVWTGSEMIIFGGQVKGGQDITYSGWRYNPTTDVWAMLPYQTDMGDLGVSLNWDGSQAFIWSGWNINGSIYSNGKAYYNPTNNNLTAMYTSTGEPVARAYHSAVWTGSEMIIWGGQNAGGYRTDGARFNPVTNTWTAISSAGAPGGRIDHSTVWNGTEMIVWGGRNGTSVFDTGGRYNPVTNSWVATSIVAQPSSRFNHTGVWTGDKMLIWGGESGGVSFSTGGAMVYP